MSLIRCIECGTEYSSFAKACSNCACPTIINNQNEDELKTNRYSDSLQNEDNDKDEYSNIKAEEFKIHNKGGTESRISNWFLIGGLSIIGMLLILIVYTGNFYYFLGGNIDLFIATAFTLLTIYYTRKVIKNHNFHNRVYLLLASIVAYIGILGYRLKLYSGNSFILGMISENEPSYNLLLFMDSFYFYEIIIVAICIGISIALFSAYMVLRRSAKE